MPFSIESLTKQTNKKYVQLFVIEKKDEIVSGEKLKLKLKKKCSHIYALYHMDAKASSATV